MSRQWQLRDHCAARVRTRDCGLLRILPVIVHRDERAGVIP